MDLRKALQTAGILLAAALAARADIIPIGSSLTFGGYNGPGAGTDTTWSDAVTFSSTPVLVDGGALQIYQTQTPTSGGGEWDTFYMQSVSGGPVAGDIYGDWNITMDYYLSVPAYFDATAFQFTVNGTPVSPLYNFSGICCATASNPSPLTGEAWYNSGFQAPLSAGEQTNWLEIYIDPYDYVSAGGVDPSTANGFAFALHFTPQTPVPEPKALPPMLLLSAGLIWLVVRNRRRQSRPV
jgi:hypothetical protein